MGEVISMVGWKKKPKGFADTMDANEKRKRRQAAERAESNKKVLRSYNIKQRSQT
jgi:hypothetical protein